MKYALDVSSFAMTYIPRFTQIGSAIQKLIEGGWEIHRLADSMEIA
jgi:tRNA A58 N-methylase Trm61